MNCILFALYLPNIKKKYAVVEIFEYFKTQQRNAQIFIGIQNNSIPETEEILRKLKGPLKIQVQRVSENMNIDSDASAFISALELYSKTGMNFEKCYFVHSKGITSNNDNLRKFMYNEIFDDKSINNFFKEEAIGSYGPFITFTDVEEDIQKMSSFLKFYPTFIETFPVMEYYYINTFYVIKNKYLKKFVESVDPVFFQTPIQTYSDRYFFERDFPHIVDTFGGQPSFKMYHGNYSTNYQTPTDKNYTAKLLKWEEDKNAN